MGDNDPDKSGQPADGQAPDGAAGAGDDYQLPEKFQGKSPEEIAKAYSELEKQLGKKGDYDDRFSNLETTLTELGKAITSKESSDDEGGEDPDDMKKSHFDYIKGFGFITKDDLNNEFERGKKSYELERIFDSLESDLNGKDGRPKFDKKEVSQYAIDNGLEGVHPEKVYKIKHEKELIDWHINQAKKKGYAPPVPEGGRKSPLPDNKKVDRDNETYEQRRERITAELNSSA